MMQSHTVSLDRRNNGELMVSLQWHRDGLCYRDRVITRQTEGQADVTLLRTAVALTEVIPGSTLVNNTEVEDNA